MFNRIRRPAIALFISIGASMAIGAPTDDGGSSPPASSSPQIEKPANDSTSGDAKVRIWTAKLVDAQTGTPLERIPVEVRISKRGSRERQSITFTSGSSGEVKIPLVEGTSTYVQVKDSNWWARYRVVVGELPEDIAAIGSGAQLSPDEPVMVMLSKGTEVRGRLLKPDGQPAAGIVLYVGVSVAKPQVRTNQSNVDFGASDMGDWPTWQTKATTDEEGNFSIAIPPVQSCRWVRLGTGVGGQAAESPAQVDRRGRTRILSEFAPLTMRVNDTNADQSDDRLDLGTLQLKTNRARSD